MENTGTHDGMKYVGDGTQLGYVPTRDLTADEVKLYGENILLASGLYIRRGQTVIPGTAPKPKRAARVRTVTAKE